MTHHRGMLLALALSASLTCYAAAARADSNASDTVTIAGPATPDDQLTAEEKALAEALGKVAQVTLDTLDQANPVASNAGLGELFDRLSDRRKELENLAKGLDEAGKPMSRKALKKVIGATGANKLKQLLDAQKDALERAAHISKFPKITSELGTIFDAVELSSKAAGALAEGDVDGAFLQLLNGGCKMMVTGAAGLAGGALGAPLSPAASIALGTVAAGAADVAYDASLGELFRKLDMVTLSIDQYQKVNTQRFMKLYGDLASVNGVTFADMYGKYMAGQVSEGDFRDFNRMIRPKIQKRSAEIAAERAKSHALALEGLRKLGLSINLSEDIEKYGAGTLDLRGQIALLKAVQSAKAGTCKQELPRDIMRDRLAGIGYGKFMRVMTASNLKTPVNLLSCFCSSYSIAGVGISYLPEARQGCPANEGPCKGGNFGCVSYGLPGSPAVWDSCVSGNPLADAEDESGRPVPVTRIDEYLANKRIMMEIIKK